MAFPGTSWATRTPAQVGLKATKLTDFRNATGNNVGFVVKNGYQVFKWGATSGRIDWASAGKPLTSTMLFFAVKEGKLGGVDALIKDFDWALRTADQNMTFRHLANMLSGYALPETLAPIGVTTITASRCTTRPCSRVCSIRPPPPS